MYLLQKSKLRRSAIPAKAENFIKKLTEVAQDIVSMKHLLQTEGSIPIRKDLAIFAISGNTKNSCLIVLLLLSCVFQERNSSPSTVLINTDTYLLLTKPMAQCEGALQASKFQLEQVLLCRFCYDDYKRCQIVNWCIRCIVLVTWTEYQTRNQVKLKTFVTSLNYDNCNPSDIS